jgi:mycothiol system anti-sigma-R factor
MSGREQTVIFQRGSCMEQPDCFTGDEEINLYLDEEMEAGRYSRLKSHLSICRDCSIRFKIAYELKTAVKKSCRETVAPAWLREKILETIRKEEPVRGGYFWESIKSVFSGRPLVPVGIAAALVIVLASAIFYAGPKNGNMPFIKDLVHEHYEYLEEVIDLGIESQDASVISDWVLANTGMNIKLPPPQESLMPGGACVLEEDDEAIGYVYFDNFDKRISLFMLENKYENLFGQKIMKFDDISLYCGTCTGMNYVLWKNGDVVCVLVGDLPESSLVGLAENFI